MAIAGERVAPETGREFLRHTLATLVYRGSKSLRDVPEGFADFRTSDTTRTPRQILAHIGDLLDWALSMARDKQEWRDSGPRDWDDEVSRFYAGAKALDEYLDSGEPLGITPEELFQGPIADALTHLGQIAMLRRMAGAPVRGENYYKAEIVKGRVGPEQATPRREFD